MKSLGKLINTLTGHTNCINIITSVSIQNSNYLISGSTDSTVQLWNSTNNNSLYKLQTNHTDSIQAITYQPQMKLLAIGSKDKSLSLWRIKDYNLNNIKTILNHTDIIFTLAILPNFNIVSGGRDKSVKIWNSTTFQLIATLTGFTDSIRSLAILPNSNIVTGCDDSNDTGIYLQIWNSTNYKLITSLIDKSNQSDYNLTFNHLNSVWALAIIPGTNEIVSAGHDSIIRIWQSAYPYKLVNYLFGHRDTVQALVVLPNTHHIVSGGCDLSIKIWKSNLTIANLTGHNDCIQSLAVLSNQIVSGSKDTTIKLWNSESFVLITTLYGHTGSVNALSILSNSNNILVVSGSADNTIKIWNLTSFELQADFIAHNKSIKSIIVSNNTIISGSDDFALKYWQLSNYTLFNNFIPVLNRLNQTSQVTALTFFNTIYLIVGLSDSSIIYYNILNMNTFSISNGHTQRITCLFNFNDKYLLSGSMDRKIIVWNSNLVKSNELTVHEGIINSIVYLSAKSYLVSSSYDTSIIY